MRVALLALIACTPAVQAPKPPADPPLPLWPEVRTGRLDNGLTYYILPHAAPAHRAYVWLVVKAGSVDEADDQRGIAHLVEHMAFEGTKRFANHAIESYLDSIGMRLGADLNAHTTFDHTTFELTVPTDKAEYVDTAIAMVRDFAGDVAFEDGGLAHEKKIVHEEWRRALGANQRMLDRQVSITFAGSRYVDRSPIGVPDIVANASRDTILAFYRKWYRADRMAVIVVGDIEPKAIEARVRDELGTLPKPAAPMPATPAMTKAAGTRVAIDTDRDVPAPRIAIIDVAPHRPVASRGDARRQLAAELYAIISDWRLSTEARRANAPFLSAQVAFETPTDTFDTMSRVAVAKTDRIDDAIHTLVLEQRRIDQFGVTQVELDRAKKLLAANGDDNARSSPTRDGRAFTSELVRHFTTGEFTVGPDAERELTASLLPTITPADVAKVAADYAGDRAILITGASDLPVADKVTAVVADAERATVEAWKPPAEAKPLLDTPPTPGKITKEKSLDAVGAVEWTLSNGVRVVVKRTDFAAGTFEVAGVSPGGYAMIDDADLPEASYATEVAALGGLGTRTGVEVAASLIGKTAHATAALGLDSESIAAGGDARDAETVLQLVYLRMAAPRYDAKAVAVWKGNLPERVTTMRQKPEVEFEIESTEALYQNNPRRTAFPKDRLAALDADKAFAIYKQRFGDATDFTFVIVGDIDPAALRPLVERYLASLPAMGRVDAPKDRGIKKAPGVLARSWKHGHDPKAQVRLELHGDLAWSRDAAHDLEIVRHAVDARLHSVLREDKGGVYNVGVSALLAHSGGRSLAIRFACDPARVDELVKATFDELAALGKQVPDELLASLAANYVRARETQLRDNGFWTFQLAQAYLYGDDPAHIATDDLRDRMKPDLVRAAIKTFADPKQYAQLVLLPEP